MNRPPVQSLRVLAIEIEHVDPGCVAGSYADQLAGIFLP
jgi:hypothetical protein